MTDPTPDVPTPDSEEDEAQPLPLPRWIPVLIGVALVAMAALAIYTGMRRGGDELTAKVSPQREPVMNAAPPGEPGAGASLVMHGGEGDQTPAANQAVAGDARAEIRGGPGGLETTVRIWARRGMQLDVAPVESMVSVNGVTIGQAGQFDTVDEIYEFAAPGSYTVQVVAPNNRRKTFIVTAAEDAKQDVARIAVRF